ncbi:hypothetical protein ILYODFUR_012533 [Ilyodon furcidens]|uniref:Uncharacterized protein n=1 Tax=Ilyodon furcidens TaxID=33524 RepID=A0ABV0U7K5_9TELE
MLVLLIIIIIEQKHSCCIEKGVFTFQALLMQPGWYSINLPLAISPTVSFTLLYSSFSLPRLPMNHFDINLQFPDGAQRLAINLKIGQDKFLFHTKYWLCRFIIVLIKLD